MTAPTVGLQEEASARLDNISSRLGKLVVSLREHDNDLRKFVVRVHEDMDIEETAYADTPPPNPTPVLWYIENSISDCEGVLNHLNAIVKKLGEIG